MCVCFLLRDGEDLEGGKKGNTLDLGGLLWPDLILEVFQKASPAFPLPVPIPIHKQRVCSESPGAMPDSLFAR